MTKTQKQICKQIADHYSTSTRLGVFQEEAAEMIVAISKVNRELPDCEARYIDALADLSIMIEEQVSRMDEDERVEYYMKINEKLGKRMDIIQAEQADGISEV